MPDRNLDETLQAFEGAYTPGFRPNISDYLPPENRNDYLEFVTELIRVDIELSRQYGLSSSLEDYKKRYADVFADPRSCDRICFEDYRTRVDSGETCAPSDYQRECGIKTYHWPVLGQRSIE